jgi:hypothetical protein
MSLFISLLRGPMRRSASVDVLSYASLGLPSLGPLATAAEQAQGRG